MREVGDVRVDMLLDLIKSCRGDDCQKEINKSMEIIHTFDVERNETLLLDIVSVFELVLHTTSWIPDVNGREIFKSRIV